MERTAGPTAFEEWEERVCHTFVPLRAQYSRGSDRFVGDVRSTHLGSVALAEVTASEAIVERTATLIRRDDPEMYKFGLQVSGERHRARGGGFKR